VDDLLAALGILVMFEQEAVIWSGSVYQVPMVRVFYAEVLSGTTMIWYVRLSCMCPFFSSHLRVVRLARGSILASVIRIMGSSPLKVGALYASGLFVVFYVVTVAQFLWVCEVYEPHPTEYVTFFGLPFVSCSC
jgi:hypothetical protein